MRRSYKDGDAKRIWVGEQNFFIAIYSITVWNTDARLIKPAKFEQGMTASQASLSVDG